jgi:hypothetical protein
LKELLDVQVGAEHYKKLALEKAQPVSCNCQSYLQQIQMLSVEVRNLLIRIRWIRNYLASWIRISNSLNYGSGSLLIKDSKKFKKKS